jgi:hypothetical protein
MLETWSYRDGKKWPVGIAHWSDPPSYEMQFGALEFTLTFLPTTTLAPVVAQYRAATRIALEMATREHSERRALENEIALLRNEWLEAEEIAALAAQLPFGIAPERQFTDVPRV